MLGPGSVSGYFDGPIVYGAQTVVGAPLLGYAVLAPDSPGGRRRSAGRETLLWILGIAGFLLLADILR